MLTDEQFLYFSKQVLLPTIGEGGQSRLLNRRIAIIGLGGLGHLMATVAASMGVGTIVLVDGDRVQASNLARQWSYGPKQIGALKAIELAAGLRSTFPHSQFEPVAQFITTKGNWAERRQLSDADMIVDCTDNLETRALISRLFYQRPIISLAASGEQAWIATLGRQAQAGDYRCLHCLWPADQAPKGDCASMGVSGALLTATVGMGAQILLTRLLNPAALLGRVWFYQSNTISWQSCQLPACSHCKAKEQSHA